MRAAGPAEDGNERAGPADALEEDGNGRTMMGADPSTSLRCARDDNKGKEDIWKYGK